MKYLLVTTCLLMNLCVFAQIPEIRFAAGNGVRDTSLLYETLRGQYDFVIAYTEGSYWSGNRIYYRMFALRRGQWSFLTLFASRRKNGNLTFPIIKEQWIPEAPVLFLLNQLSEINFWALRNDSLNIQTRQVNETTTEIFNLSDGVNERFEVMTRTGYHVIQAYEPAYYLENLPEITCRKTFILGRNLFQTILWDMRK